MHKKPICQYCGIESAKVNGSVIYSHRPDLSHKIFYLCEPCNAYVGCHPNTDKPLGTLANKQLRRYRNRTHAIFDKIWKDKCMSRKSAYKWLSESLGIPKEQTHVAMFGIDTCKRTIEVCEQYFKLKGE